MINKFIHSGLNVIEIEQLAIANLASSLNDNFVKACEIMLACVGRVIVTGMGKSGHIARKIAATLASTGTPAFYIHPGEANHGDMGMVTRQDVVLALSHSGETQEILTLLPLILRLNIPLISMTGNAQSTLSTQANVDLHIPVTKEACSLGLAPTSSTTASLVMGDAIAMALLEARGFTSEDFAFTHPGGSLGRQLLLTVDSLLHRNEEIPKVQEEVLLSHALIEMTKKRLGMTTIFNHQNQLVGIYTDGDLRRSIQNGVDIHRTPIGDLMIRNFKTIDLGTLAAKAIKIMENFKITSLPVLDAQQQLAGILHMHDLLQAGIR